MPDDLYERDILVWSENQAELLRRLARGERVNGVDWEHLVEEIEDVGRSEFGAVRSYLTQVLLHLLKVHGWPKSPARNHWLGAITGFQQEAADRFTPSMRQRIDVPRLYENALARSRGLEMDGTAPLPFPAACPFTLDQLLGNEREALLERLHAAAV